MAPKKKKGAQKSKSPRPSPQASAATAAEVSASPDAPPESGDTEAQDAVPALLFVDSPFGNIKGLFERVLGEDCEGRPTYTNDSVFLFYDTKVGCWVVAPQVTPGGGSFVRAVDGAVKGSQAALIPVDVGAWEGGGGKTNVITRIQQVPRVTATERAQAPERLQVKSNFSNVRGVFECVPEEDSVGRPSYRHKGGTCMYFSRATCAWILGPELQGRSFLAKVDSFAVNPVDIQSGAWGDTIQEVTAADAPVVGIANAPESILVQAEYAEVRGVYHRNPERGPTGRPRYKNRHNVHLYFHEDISSWLFGPKVDSDQFYLRAEMNATSPLDIPEGSWNQGCVKILNIEDVDKAALRSAPARVVVKSAYGNVTGLYKRVDGQDVAGRPAYQSVRSHQTCLYFFEDFGCWAFGDTIGSEKIYLKAIVNSAAHPLDLPFQPFGDNIDELWELPDTVDEQLVCCPNAMGFESNYGNVRGGYVRISDYAFFPAYYSEDNDVYLWHDVAERKWILTHSKPGTYDGKTLLTWSSIDVDPSSLKGQEGHFYNVTWHEHKHESDFVDRDFPPDDTSLGELKDVEYEVEWIRITDILREVNYALWQTIEPDKVMQGNINDCWLLSALSGLAEYPHKIEELFLTGGEVKQDGQYQMRLFDVAVGRWIQIVVDDFIPCKKRLWWEKRAQPVGARPFGLEIWVLLLEKAFAKFVGSYASLDGGDSAWAWQAITGGTDIVMFKRSEDSLWREFNNDLDQQKAKIIAGEKRGMAYMGEAGKQGHSVDEFWKLVKSFQQMNFLMSCGIVKKEDKAETPNQSEKEVRKSRKSVTDVVRNTRKSVMQRASVAGKTAKKGIQKMVSKGKVVDEKKDKVRPDGLIEGHAYAILNAEENKGIRLVQLQNPWGDSTEWNGAWSDSSKEWADHPDMASWLRPNRRHSARGMDNGMFWMSFDDFTKIFDNLAILRLAMIDPKLQEEMMGKVNTNVHDKAVHLRKIFKQWDRSGKGLIAKTEFRFILERLGDVFEQGDCDAMFNEIDVDGSGEINFVEFCDWLARSGKTGLSDLSAYRLW